MKTKKNKQPVKIYPIWIFVIIVYIFSSSLSVQSGALLGAIIVSSMLHSKNKKKFGKNYRKIYYKKRK